MEHNINIVSDIINKATKLFNGDEEKARDWLNTENSFFGGHSPFSYCKPYDGAVKVEEYLDQKLKQKEFQNAKVNKFNR